MFKKLIAITLATVITLIGVVAPVYAATTQKENTLILRIGKFKKDDINDLRDGEGKVFRKIESVLEQLQDSGHISDNYQPIIVITKRKSETDF